MTDFQLRILGVRGSKPVCDKNFLKFGGNTFCVEIVAGDQLIIFDAGTGISNIEVSDKFPQVHLFFTHYHIDHIAGLYYFSYLQDSTKTVNFYGFNNNRSLQQIIGNIFDSAFFPVELQNFGASYTFHTVKNFDTVNLTDDLKISAFPLEHPGGCMGYAVYYKGKKISICTDMSLPSGNRLNEFYDFVNDSDYMIFDSFFMPEEFIAEWGHSSYEDALTILKNSDVRYVLLTHFSYTNDDEKLLALEKKLNGIDKRLILCREGMRIEI